MTCAARHRGAEDRAAVRKHDLAPRRGPGKRKVVAETEDIVEVRNRPLYTPGRCEQQEFAIIPVAACERDEAGIRRVAGATDFRTVDDPPRPPISCDHG